MSVIRYTHNPHLIILKIHLRDDEMQEYTRRHYLLNFLQFMESHSSVHGTHKEKGSSGSVESKNLDIDNQPAALVAFNAIAKARYTSAKDKYDSYLEAARKFDDDQAKFSSKLENFLKACEIGAKAALLTDRTLKN